MADGKEEMTSWQKKNGGGLPSELGVKLQAVPSSLVYPGRSLSDTLEGLARPLPFQETAVDPIATLQAVQAWPVEEQLEFLFRAWDQVIDGGWQAEMTEELRAELDRRLAAHQANPSNVLTWEQVVASVRQPR